MDKMYEFKKSDYLYIGLILISIIILFAKNQYVYGIILTLLLIGLIVYFNLIYSSRKDKLKNMASLVSKQVSKSVFKSLESVGIPIIMFKDSGEVVWHNKIAEKLFIKNVSERYNDKLIGDEITNFLLETKEKSTDSEIDGKKYHIDKIAVDLHQDEFYEQVTILIFNDKTETQKDELKRVSAMYLEIDNYNDLLESIDPDKKPFLIAEIEKEVYAYASHLKAMIRRYGTNKYIFITSDYNINLEINKKFSILEEIKTIHKGNTIEPSLSIGIGSKGITPEENQRMAIGAKELALGRGGDQVVIKTPDDLKFFGGNVKEIEKKSRVRSRVLANSIKNLFLESGSIYIMGHINPDLDSLGASVGIATIARGLNKEHNIILGDVNDNIEYALKRFKDLDEYKDLFIKEKEAKEKINKKNDVLVVVDVHSKTYVLNNKIVEMFDKVVIIDHHRRALDQIENTVLSYIENYASSASELVTELIQYSFDKPILKPIEAEALYLGISVDTKSFTFKTGVRTFDAASFLKRQGVNTESVREMFNHDIESYNEKSDIIKKAEIRNKIAISKVYDSKSVLLSAQAADELSSFRGIKASFVLTKIGNDILINARSAKDINVQVILEELGGGGHMNMAGATLYNISMDKVYEMLIETIDKNIKGDI